MWTVLIDGKHSHKLTQIALMVSWLCRKTCYGGGSPGEYPFPAVLDPGDRRYHRALAISNIASMHNGRGPGVARTRVISLQVTAELLRFIEWIGERSHSIERDGYGATVRTSNMPKSAHR